MALPNTNISTTLVGQTLGTSSRDVGTLCTHPNINKWSKWKPYRYNSLNGLTESIIKSINFGMSPVLMNPSELPSSKALENSLFIWGQWLPPRGGSFNEFFRLGDYRNYNHIAQKFLVEVQLRNHNGGIRPVTGNPNYSFVPTYIGRLIFNHVSDISLSEFSLGGLNTYNLYLTLIIGGNIGGLSFTNSLIGQSDTSLGEVLDSGSSEMVVELDTYNLADTILTNNNIIFLYLAPKITSQFLQGVSLKVESGINSAEYNSSYAMYGDGSTDGGSPPTTVAVGTWWWLSTNPTITADASNIGTMSFDVLRAEVTTGTPGFATLRVYISELGRDMEVTITDKINLGQSGQQTIDTSLMSLNIGSIINQDTGQPYSSLTCKFYAISITPTVIAQFNEQNINIPIVEGV